MVGMIARGVCAHLDEFLLGGHVPREETVQRLLIRNQERRARLDTELGLQLLLLYDAAHATCDEQNSAQELCFHRCHAHRIDANVGCCMLRVGWCTCIAFIRIVLTRSHSSSACCCCSEPADLPATHTVEPALHTPYNLPCALRHAPRHVAAKPAAVRLLRTARTKPAHRRARLSCLAIIDLYIPRAHNRTRAQSAHTGGWSSSLTGRSCMAVVHLLLRRRILEWRLRFVCLDDLVQWPTRLYYLPPTCHTQ